MLKTLSRRTALAASALSCWLVCTWPVALHAQTPGQAAAGRMPTISAENLNEKPFTLPAQLPAERTLVLVAFER
jgi:hypothetical protein